MEILEERLLADEGQRVWKMCTEPGEDALVGVEAVELRCRREDGAGERAVLHAHTTRQRLRETWKGFMDGVRTLLGSAISMKVCRGQM